MVAKQCCKGLGLGVNEHGIKNLINVSPKHDMHGIGYSSSQFHVADINYRPSLDILLPTPTLDHPDTPQDVAKKVYVQLMNSKKEKFKPIPKNALHKYKCPFHNSNKHLLADCVHFKLYVRDRASHGIISYS